MTTDYVYEQLDDKNPYIRVLYLLPATDEQADIHGTLQVIPMARSEDVAHPYEALSYVWGSSEKTHTVYLSEYSHRITSNLDAALRHLRHKSQIRMLWADAICINQADNHEKSIQVGRMRYVYANASQVLVWLGLGDKDTDEAIASLALETEDPAQDLLNVSVMAGFSKIFTCAWWSRVWVYQEAMVASKRPLVICGHSQFLWADLNKMYLDWHLIVACVGESSKNRGIDIVAYQDFVDIPTAYSSHSLEAKSKSVSLSEALRATCHRSASDPRDKVFGVLGLVTDSSVNFLQPDYTQLVSQVYQAAAVSILQTEQNFDILHRTLTQCRRDDLPTWCPDFSTKEWASLEKGNRFFPLRDTPHFEAYRGMIKSFVSHDTLSDSIALTGVKVGRIVTARPSYFTSSVIARYRYPPGERGRAPTAAGAVNRLWVEISHVSEEIYRILSKTVGVDEAKRRLAGGEAWRTMNAAAPLYKHADFSFSRWLSLTESDFNDGYWLLEKDLQQRRTERYGTSNMPPWSDLLPKSDVQNLRSWAMFYLLKIPPTLEGTSFFITENDWYGVSACCVEEGDLLCILFGCRLPAILRPHEGKHQLISFAHVPGIMQGEFVRDVVQTENIEKKFEII